MGISEIDCLITAVMYKLILRVDDMRRIWFWTWRVFIFSLGVRPFDHWLSVAIPLIINLFLFLGWSDAIAIVRSYFSIFNYNSNFSFRCKSDTILQLISEGASNEYRLATTASAALWKIFVSFSALPRKIHESLSIEISRTVVFTDNLKSCF